LGTIASTAQSVDQFVMCDCPHPRFERLAIIPGMPLQMQREQSLLHDILTLIRAAPGADKPLANESAKPWRQTQEQ
jgi:hypothetical protein